MKALVARAYGPLEGLVFQDVPTPVPGPDELLVRTQAAAVNAADVVLVTGRMRKALPVKHPFVPGVDLSGVVAAVGSAVSRFRVGDPVLAWLGLASGAMAEWVLVKEDLAALRPAGLDAARAAALATGGLTGSALVDAAALRPGESVLVWGAAGGVGSFVVQLAKETGAQVLATGRAEDAEYLRRLGADQTIDYTDKNVATEVRRLVPGGVDAVIDVAHVSPDILEPAASVTAGGRLLYVLGGLPPTLDRGVTATYTGAADAPRGRLRELAEQAAEGRLRVELSATYAFTDAKRALGDFATQHVRGKVALTF
ncbi:NADP-dependent oxidoreductase [Streptomyces olivaceoviridis]|uniref:NADP-dependent oxidoreductase n=1 Tax=Streptomyces olivaceoviridis TaxID=1921 RepID=UPI0036A31B23